MAVNDYSPYGLIKKGTDYGLSKVSKIYNNNRAKNSTQVGRSTSMNNFVTNAPVERNPNFQFGKDYSLAGADATALGYTEMPTGILPTLNNAPINPVATSPAIKPPVLNRKGASAPPLVAPTAIVPTQPQVVPTGVPEAVQPTSPMEVAMYNARANGEIADKNNQTLKDVAQMGAKSDWEKYGSLASGVGTMAGGLAGIYGAYANAKYQKDQTKMQKAMIRGDEANKSAFAKAAGGTYQSSGV
jgi:hypothetical protein